MGISGEEVRKLIEEKRSLEVKVKALKDRNKTLQNCYDQDVGDKKKQVEALKAENERLKNEVQAWVDGRADTTKPVEE
jgi:FtsZ-binding cell division protein ZapB